MDSSNIKGSVIFVIGFAAFYNLLDFLFVTFISRDTFAFAFGHNIVYPLVIAVLACAISYSVDRMKQRKEERTRKPGKHERR